MEDDNLPVNEFTLRIEFEKGSENPARVFNAMSEFIKAFHDLDNCLAKAFAVNIQPILVLQDIESGSIRTILSSFLKVIDDDALKDLDWKKQVGKYLVKAKHKIIKFLDEEKELKSIEPIRRLEGELYELAKETDIQHIPLYTTVPTQKLLESIGSISRAPYFLTDKDHVSLLSEEGEDKITRGPYITSQTIEELLTKETLNKQKELILLVKKPIILEILCGTFNITEEQYRLKFGILIG